MQTILLLGAGFSRNWGGWLADEVFEYLIGHHKIIKNIELRNTILKYRKNGGFEKALQKLQIAKRNGAKNRLDDLQEAIIQMFDEMNESFAKLGNFSPLLQDFLGKFDAIFTLNQDLLIEGHYHCNNNLLFSDLSNHTQLVQASHQKWGYWHTPSVEHPEVRGIPHPKQIYEGRWYPQENGLKILPDRQPYFKLHGSSNWRDKNGERMLIMGDGKTNQIKFHKILSWYHDKFKEYLEKPNTRLMIIGYSFGDSHINDILINAGNKNGLKVFIIDPQGIDVIGQHNKSRGGAIKYKEPIEEIIEQITIGASRRNLNKTFQDNNIEYKKIMRFFTDNSDKN